MTTNPNRYLPDSGWLESIGTPWLTFLEKQALGDGTERRVLFEGTVDVDLVPISHDAFRRMVAGKCPPEIAGVFRRGFRFVLDKDGLEKPMENSLSPAPPTREEFRALCNDF